MGEVGVLGRSLVIELFIVDPVDREVSRSDEDDDPSRGRPEDAAEAPFASSSSTCSFRPAIPRAGPLACCSSAEASLVREASCCTSCWVTPATSIFTALSVASGLIALGGLGNSGTSACEPFVLDTSSEAGPLLGCSEGGSGRMGGVLSRSILTSPVDAGEDTALAMVGGGRLRPFLTAAWLATSKA